MKFILKLSMVLIVSLTMASSMNAQQRATETVKSSYVCYVNNAFMGKEQIPVHVNGKIYYGCCQGCVEKLENDRSLRYAIDPFTGKEVDKATAYIVLKKDGSSDVLYFENKENHQAFLLKN